MKLRILLIFLPGMAAALPAAGDTVRIARADCGRLAQYRAAPDVAFKPGVDVRGRKVTPAGGPDGTDYGKLIPDMIEFSIALNPLKGGAARFGETTLKVGVIGFDMKRRRATLNGRALSPDDTRKLSQKCRDILRRAK